MGKDFSAREIHASRALAIATMEGAPLRCSLSPAWLPPRSAEAWRQVPVCFEAGRVRLLSLHHRLEILSGLRHDVRDMSFHI